MPISPNDTQQKQVHSSITNWASCCNLRTQTTIDRRLGFTNTTRMHMRNVRERQHSAGVIRQGIKDRGKSDPDPQRSCKYPTQPAAPPVDMLLFDQQQESLKGY